MLTLKDSRLAESQFSPYHLITEARNGILKRGQYKIHGLADLANGLAEYLADCLCLAQAFFKFTVFTFG